MSNRSTAVRKECLNTHVPVFSVTSNEDEALSAARTSAEGRAAKVSTSRRRRGALEPHRLVSLRGG